MVDRVIDHPEAAEVLFKPVQRRIIEKLSKGTPLEDNEKRYLRGNLGKKISALENLLNDNNGELSRSHPILHTLQNYYISGYEALRHNGFGWFYDVKTITVMNTSIKGSSRYKGRKYIFIRVRSMKNRSKAHDPATGIFFATNEQIIKDAFELKDESLKWTWISMLDRYGNMFVDSTDQYYSEICEDSRKEEGSEGEVVGGRRTHRRKAATESIANDLSEYGV